MSLRSVLLPSFPNALAVRPTAIPPSRPLISLQAIRTGHLGTRICSSRYEHEQYAKWLARATGRRLKRNSISKQWVNDLSLHTEENKINKVGKMIYRCKKKEAKFVTDSPQQPVVRVFVRHTEDFLSSWAPRPRQSYFIFLSFLRPGTMQRRREWGKFMYTTTSTAAAVAYNKYWQLPHLGKNIETEVSVKVQYRWKII